MWRAGSSVSQKGTLYCPDSLTMSLVLLMSLTEAARIPAFFLEGIFTILSLASQLHTGCPVEIAISLPPTPFQCQSFRLGYRSLFDSLMTTLLFLNCTIEFLGEFPMEIIGATMDYIKAKVETFLLEGICVLLSSPIMILCTICT